MTKWKQSRDLTILTRFRSFFWQISAHRSICPRIMAQQWQSTEKQQHPTCIIDTDANKQLQSLPGLLAVRRPAFASVDQPAYLLSRLAFSISPPSLFSFFVFFFPSLTLTLGFLFFLFFIEILFVASHVFVAIVFNTITVIFFYFTYISFYYTWYVCAFQSLFFSPFLITEINKHSV